MEQKYLNYLVQMLNGSKKSYFLNFQHGQKNYLLIINLIQILFLPNTRKNEVVKFVEKVYLTFPSVEPHS